MTTPDPTPEDLRVTAATEIRAYLQQLHLDGTEVLLSGPQGSLRSRICALDTQADLVGLHIGADPDGLSQTLVADAEITAVAYLGAIKLQFELEAPVLVIGEQGTVLRGAVPGRLYRFQRRQSYRVQPAGSAYPRVVLPGGAQAGRAARVLDISVGGLALALPAGSDALPLGQVAQGLVLELERGNALRVALLPHHASPLGSQTQQLGCSFVDLEAAAARSLQVYVDQTQKRRRLLKLDA